MILHVETSRYSNSPNGPRHHQLHLGLRLRLQNNVVNFLERCSLQHPAVPLQNLVAWTGDGGWGDGGERQDSALKPRRRRVNTQLSDDQRHRGFLSSIREGTGESVPGRRWPTVSAKLPLFTLVMNAHSLPDSVIFPPTT